MTYIEFFEKDVVENICTCLIKQPDRVILIGDNLKRMQKSIEIYKKILSDKGIETEFLCRSVCKNNIQTIIDFLSQIIETYEDCVFDLTGGEDLYLVAMGIVFERYKDKGIQMHRFNIKNGTIIDCDQDGQTVWENEPIELSVEENIRLYGGEVVCECQKENSTISWDMTDDFKKDIDNIWEICKADARAWNMQIGFFAAAEKAREQSSSHLTTIAFAPYLTNMPEVVNGMFGTNRRILEELRGAGLIKEYVYNKKKFLVTYKNEQVKLCLTKAGQALEMKMYKAALEASEKDGSPTYNDVMTSVYIDWDGNIHADQSGCDTINEIDVIMMHGLVPVFVSCKNGRIDIDELYKLTAVANRFGGKYAKKVLMATVLGDDPSSEYIKQRANDMDIHFVGNLHKMSDSEFNRAVRSFWSN